MQCPTTDIAGCRLPFDAQAWSPKDAHDSIDVPEHDFQDPQARGPAWVQYWFGDDPAELSDVDDVRAHALRLSEHAFADSLTARPTVKQSKTFARAQAACSSNLGLHGTSSAIFWTSSGVTDRQRSLALQVRFGVLPTRARIAKWYPGGEVDATCSLCHAPQDTVGHRLGACTFPSVKNQICARHGYAVNAIAAQLRDGAHGKDAFFVDAECHDRYISFPANVLPHHMQTSRPDIVLLENVPAMALNLPYWSPRDPRLAVHLVEVTYTSDFHVHDRVQAKREQHAQLRRNFLDFGWQKVSIHVFVIGHTGVMREANASLLIELGVLPDRVSPFLCGLSVSSLQKSCAILSCFPALRSESTQSGEAQAELSHATVPAPSLLPIALHASDSASVGAALTVEQSFVGLPALHTQSAPLHSIDPSLAIPSLQCHDGASSPLPSQHHVDASLPAPRTYSRRRKRPRLSARGAGIHAGLTASSCLQQAPSTPALLPLPGASSGAVAPMDSGARAHTYSEPELAHASHSGSGDFRPSVSFPYDPGG